jgi:hypothetical protein
MLFENNISSNIRTAFVSKVKDIAGKLSIKPDWLMAMMYSESKLNPQAINNITNATGLIQFMPATANGLGTTTSALYNMSALNQLDYVYKYFKPYANYINSYDDLYLITFYPNADGKFAGTLSKPDTWTFPSAVYTSNKGMDINGDGKVNISDFKQFIYRNIPAEAKKYFNLDEITKVKKLIGRNKVAFGVVSLIIIGATIYFIKKL